MSAQRMLRAGAVMLVFWGVGAWPASALRQRVSETCSVLINPWLTGLTFGQSGRAVVRSIPGAIMRRPGENVTADAELVLQIQRPVRHMVAGFSLRREVYLPLLTFVALVCAAPVLLRAKVYTLLLGAPLVLAASCAALYTTICWLFAHNAPRDYVLSASELEWLDTVFNSLIVPPALRFFAPVLIAVILLGTLTTRSSLPATSRHALHTPAAVNET